MLVASFFSWWYSRGWAFVVGGFGRRSQALAQAFSISQLGKTLFAPWRRIITYPGASLAERFRAWGDNVFSRAIGFVIRLFVLLAALIAWLIIMLLTLVELIAWPLLPLSIPVFIAVGLS